MKNNQTPPATTATATAPSLPPPLTGTGRSVDAAHRAHVGHVHLAGTLPWFTFSIYAPYSARRHLHRATCKHRSKPQGITAAYLSSNDGRYPIPVWGLSCIHYVSLSISAAALVLSLSLPVCLLSLRPLTPASEKRQLSQCPPGRVRATVHCVPGLASAAAGGSAGGHQPPPLVAGIASPPRSASTDFRWPAARPRQASTTGGRPPRDATWDLRWTDRAEGAHGTTRNCVGQRGIT